MCFSGTKNVFFTQSLSTKESTLYLSIPQLIALKVLTSDVFSSTKLCLGRGMYSTEMHGYVKM